jgi:hypothetical protein
MYCSWHPTYRGHGDVRDDCDICKLTKARKERYENHLQFIMSRSKKLDMHNAKGKPNLRSAYHPSPALTATYKRSHARPRTESDGRV